MIISQECTIQTRKGANRYVSECASATQPSWVAILVHGYGEHIGRYKHVARALVATDAVVYGPDHEGHGKSEGERALIEDFERVVEDLNDVVIYAMKKHPALPMVLIGHSMGGLISARYAQRFGRELSALVLSGPAFGSRGPFTTLLSLDPIPDIPLDPAMLCGILKSDNNIPSTADKRRDR